MKSDDPHFRINYSFEETIPTLVLFLLITFPFKGDHYNR